MMSLRCLSLAVALVCSVAVAHCQVNITTLPHSIAVSAEINGQPVSPSNNQLVHNKDNLTVMWSLNQTFAGTDSSYATVVIRLCFGAPSQQGRAWRKKDQDLSLSKACYTTIATQNYNASGNMTVWTAPDKTPGAMYFIRVFALNDTSTSATPAYNAVAMGQTTNANETSDLITVVPYEGTTTTLTVTIIVLSISSYVFLVGFFVVERWVKKNK